jgi:hypothetical protein
VIVILIYLNWRLSYFKFFSNGLRLLHRQQNRVR